MFPARTSGILGSELLTRLALGAGESFVLSPQKDGQVTVSATRLLPPLPKQVGVPPALPTSGKKQGGWPVREISLLLVNDAFPLPPLLLLLLLLFFFLS